MSLKYSEMHSMSGLWVRIAICFPVCTSSDILCSLLALPIINYPGTETLCCSCSFHCSYIKDSSQVPAVPFFFSGSSGWSYLYSKPMLELGLCFILLCIPPFPSSVRCCWGYPFPAARSYCALSFHMSHLQTSWVSSCSPGQHNLLLFTHNILKLLESDCCLCPSLLCLLWWALAPD